MRILSWISYQFAFLFQKENNMNPIASFIKRYPQGVFWGIAYVIGFGGYFMSVWYPSDAWILVIFGIFLGGALVTGIVDGRDAVKTYFSRLVRFRAGIQWYAIALLTPFVLGFIALGASLLTGAKISGNFPAFGAVAEVFVFSCLTISLGEEPGFRGFSLPRFMKSRSAFSASLIVGVLHAIWHLPLVIGGETPILDLLHPLCAAFLFTWIFNNTNGSVFIAILLHASSDATSPFFAPLFSGADTTLFTIWHAVAFVAMAVLLRVLVGRELGRKAEASMDTLAAEQPAMAR
jgi:membrane protease YdiL (CAAX protease family)